MDQVTFEESKARLEEIAELVENPEISLDDALLLYEEAVKIGLHACEVSEQGIIVEDEPEDAASEEPEAPLDDVASPDAAFPDTSASEDDRS